MIQVENDDYLVRRWVSPVRGVTGWEWRLGLAPDARRSEAISVWFCLTAAWRPVSSSVLDRRSRAQGLSCRSPLPPQSAREPRLSRVMSVWIPSEIRRRAPPATATASRSFSPSSSYTGIPYLTSSLSPGPFYIIIPFLYYATLFYSNVTL